MKYSDISKYYSQKIIWVSTLIFISLIFHARTGQAELAYGVIEVLEGSVNIHRKKGDQKLSSARIGQKVFQGDSVVTSKDSRIKIVMMDGNELSLSELSKIKIQKYINDGELDEKNATIKLAFGKLRTNIKVSYKNKQNNFRIRTATGVIGVVGTDFLTTFDPGTEKTEVVTFKGLVELGKGVNANGIINPIVILPGQTSHCSSDKSPSVAKAVPKKVFAKTLRESQVVARALPEKTDRQPASPKKPQASPVFEHTDLPASCIDCAQPIVPNVDLPPPSSPTRDPSHCPSCSIIEDGNTKVNIKLVPIN